MKKENKKIPLVYKEMPIYDEQYKEVGSKIFWSRDFLEIKAFGNHEGENYLKIKVVNQDWESKRLHKPTPPLDFIVKEKDIDDLIQVFHGEKEPIEEVNKGMLGLLMAVITDVTNDYRIAWEQGAKNKLKETELFLTSGKVELWTMGEFHSDFILRNLKDTLTNQYGTFESVYHKKEDECNKHLKPIYDELDLYDRNHLIDTRLEEQDREWFRDFEHRQYLSIQYGRKIKELDEQLVKQRLPIDEGNKIVFRETIPNIPHNKPLIDELTKLKEKKRLLGVNITERKRFAKLEKLIELTKEEKRRVKYLEKKALPWELLLNE